jgi:zinc transporter, ZIP family
MSNSLISLHPIIQALLATLFTWGMTAVGAAGVFFSKAVNRRLLDGMLGFAAGVMIAASYWSLLAPSIELAEDLGLPKWLPAVSGFLLGAGFLFAVDKLLPHLHLDSIGLHAEGIKTKWQRSVLLVLAIALHNIPEGMAVGVAFGAAAAGLGHATILTAFGLALGIGLQNLPEGLAVAAPLRREGLSANRSFFFGQLSGIVEPIGGLIGAAAVFFLRPILPYALSFAAGAMLYVVIEELLPESQHCDNTDISTIGAIIGFAIMMFLDVALG